MRQALTVRSGFGSSSCWHTDQLAPPQGTRRSGGLSGGIDRLQILQGPGRTVRAGLALSFSPSPIPQLPPINIYPKANCFVECAKTAAEQIHSKHSAHGPECRINWASRATNHVVADSKQYTRNTRCRRSMDAATIDMAAI